MKLFCIMLYHCIHDTIEEQYFNYVLYSITKTNPLSLLTSTLLISCSLFPHSHVLYNTHNFLLEESNRCLTGISLQKGSVFNLPACVLKHKSDHNIPYLRKNATLYFSLIPCLSYHLPFQHRIQP